MTWEQVQCLEDRRSGATDHPEEGSGTVELLIFPSRWSWGEPSKGILLDSHALKLGFVDGIPRDKVYGVGCPGCHDEIGVSSDG